MISFWSGKMQLVDVVKNVGLGWECCSMVECLPSWYEHLVFIPALQKREGGDSTGRERNFRK